LFEVFENRFAVHCPEAVRCKREAVRVRDDIDVRKRREVEVDEQGMNSLRSAADRNHGTTALFDDRPKCSLRWSTSRRIDRTQTADERPRARVFARQSLSAVQSSSI
jgi:hypothetical protein